MASLDTLSDDQRAVLQMLLRRDNSYEDLAVLLKTELAVVRTRARAAIAAVGPDAGEIATERRDEIADYLLGQQTVARHEATREYLRGSPAARAWAQEVADTLRPLATGPLPDIPGATTAGDIAAAAGPAPAPAPAGTGAADPAATPKGSSQLGNRLIAAGIGLVLAIAIVVALSLGGKDDNNATGDTPTQTSTGSLTTPSGDQLSVVAAASLRPPKGVQSTAKGDVAIFNFPATGQYRLGLRATGLPPSSTRGSAYGVWLYTSDAKKQFLGFTRNDVGKDGKLETVSDLSPDTPAYGAVLLTRETANSPTKPGRIILGGQMVTAQSGATATTPQAPSAGAPTTTVPSRTTTTP